MGWNTRPKYLVSLVTWVMGVGPDHPVITLALPGVGAGAVGRGLPSLMLFMVESEWKMEASHTLREGNSSHTCRIPTTGVTLHLVQQSGVQ